MPLTEANPMHMMLNPGKWNGAWSDKNRASPSKTNFVNITKLCAITAEFRVKFLVPVNGENTRGEMTFAKELIPEMHPCAFPYNNQTINDDGQSNWLLSSSNMSVSFLFC